MSPSLEENVEVVRAGYYAINREGPDAARAVVQWYKPASMSPSVEGRPHHSRPILPR
jgi:hypothetical protein